MKPSLLNTDRLRIRPVERRDIDELLRIRSDPDIPTYSEITASLMQSPISNGQLRKELKRQISKLSSDRHWVIECLRPGQVVGYVGLGTLNGRSNLSFVVARENWGQGIASEAAAAVCKYAFDHLHLYSVSAFAHKDNLRSHRVLQKIGMRSDGIASMRKPSVLEAGQSTNASFVNVASSGGNLYVSYRLDRPNIPLSDEA